MAQKINFSGSTIYINGVRIGYITNTLKFKLGVGADVVTVIDLGEGKTTIQGVVDNSTRKSGATFEIKSNHEDVINLLLNFKKQQRADGGLNLVIMPPSKKNVSYIFKPVFIVNDPDINVSADGNFTLEFEGMPTQGDAKA